MGSFSAVNNFRAALSGRWRHTVYRFSVDEHFRYWLADKVATRFTGTYMVARLGIYFSHFVFSDIPCWVTTGFFFELGLDWRYKRFAALISKRNFGVVKRTQELRFGKKRIQRFSIFGKKIRAENGRSVISILNSFKFEFRTYDSCFRFSKDMFSFFPKYKGYCRIQFRLLRVGVLMGLRFFFRTVQLRSRTTLKKQSGKRYVQFLPYFTNSRVKIKLFRKFAQFYLQRFIRRRTLVSRWQNLVKWLGNRKGFFKQFGPMFFSVSILMQFRLMFGFSLKFFFSYYFRYYPRKFLQLFKTSGFSFIKKSKQSFIFLGWKPRWLRLGYKAVTRWLFNSSYLFFFRKNLFFCLVQNLKVFSLRFSSVMFSMNYLVNLSNFGVLPSKLVSNIFAYRLRRRERVNPILYSLIRLVLSRKKTLGLVILRSGRFTKRQRTSRISYRVGRVSYNSYIMPIDYSISTAILKYSMVSIKVWISTAPGLSFFTQKAIGDGNGFVYPSSLVGFLVEKYLYIWKFISSFRYFSLVRLDYANFRPFLKFFLMFRSNFIFLSSWNLKYIKAYRYFTKAFVFSRYNYIKKLRSILLGKFIFFLNVFIILKL